MSFFSLLGDFFASNIQPKSIYCYQIYCKMKREAYSPMQSFLPCLIWGCSYRAPSKHHFHLKIVPPFWCSSVICSSILNSSLFLTNFPFKPKFVNCFLFYFEGLFVFTLADFVAATLNIIACYHVLLKMAHQELSIWLFQKEGVF